MKTKDARSLPQKAQETIRIKAVEAVISGKKQVEIAQHFGITCQALNKWVKAYQENASKALKDNHTRFDNIFLKKTFVMPQHNWKLFYVIRDIIRPIRSIIPEYHPMMKMNLKIETNRSLIEYFRLMTAPEDKFTTLTGVRALLLY